MSPKIFPDRPENLPLGVVFCVNYESEIIFFDPGPGSRLTGSSKFSPKLALFVELNSHISVNMDSSETGQEHFCRELFAV